MQYSVYCFCDSRGGMLYRSSYFSLEVAVMMADQVAGQRKTAAVVQDQFGKILYSVDRS
jgi:hypothetical protein